MLPMIHQMMQWLGSSLGLGGLRRQGGGAGIAEERQPVTLTWRMGIGELCDDFGADSPGR
jgi:hypothetical protein